MTQFQVLRAYSSWQESSEYSDLVLDLQHKSPVKYLEALGFFIHLLGSVSICKDGWGRGINTFKDLDKRESYCFGMMIFSIDGAIL